MRAWHNRALHEAYGVREGLEVTLEPPQQAVEVAPGLAYDAFGRKLILEQPRRIPLPDGELPEHGLRLVMSYARGRRVGRQGSLSQACWPGDPPGMGQISLNWQSGKWFDPRTGVPLALLLPGPELAPDSYPRRSRPLARPRLAHGATLPGNTAWRLWKHIISYEAITTGEIEPTGEEVAAGLNSAIRQETREHVLGLQVEIDTSAVGFTDTPCYFAWLQGDLWAAGLVEFLDKITPYIVGADPGLRRIGTSLYLLQLLQMRFGHIHSPTASGFVYRLWLPYSAQLVHRFRAAQEYLLLLAREGALSVCWLGIQMNAQHVDTTQNNAGGTMALPKYDVREDYGIT